MSAPGRTSLCAIALAVWFSLVGVAHCDRTPATGDIAEYLNNPIRLLHGELPYRDFWLLHPPGEVLLPGAIYALGYGVNAVLLVTAAINVLVGLAAFWVGRRVNGSDLEGTAAALLVFFAGSPQRDQYVFLNADMLSALAAVGLFIGYLREHRPRQLALAGICVGVSICFKFFLGLAVAVAMLVTMLLEARARRCSTGAMIRPPLVYLAFVLIAPAALSVALAEVWPSMWQAVAIDSVSHATRPRLRYGCELLEHWPQTLTQLHQLATVIDSRNLMQAATAASHCATLVALLAAPFVTFALWYCRQTKRPATSGGSSPRADADWAVVFFLLWGELNFVRSFSAGGRFDQMLAAVTPMYFALVFLLRPVIATPNYSKGRLAWLAAGCAGIVVAGAAQRIPLETLRQLAQFRHVGHVVTAPHGALVADREEAARNTQRLVDAVLRESAEDDCIFTTGWKTPPLHALTGRRNPTYYDSLIDLCYRPSEARQREVCAALLSQKARLVVHQQNWRIQTVDTTFDAACPLIADCLEEHFEPCARVGELTLLRRKGPDRVAGQQTSDRRF